MMSSRPIRALTIGLALVFLASAYTFAQAKSVPPPNAPTVQVDHHELKRFVAAWKSVQTVQRRLTKSVDTDISKSPLSTKRFYQIYNSQRTGTKIQPKVTATEQHEYQALSHQIQSIQRLAEQEMVKAVRGDGFKVTRFNQIALALQSDSKLYKRFLHLEQAG